MAVERFSENDTKMQNILEDKIRMTIKAGRDFIKMPPENDPDDEWGQMGYHTDQELRKQQPPLYKAPAGGKITALPKDFYGLERKNDILEILYQRKSSRVYTEEPLSLLQLSFLLWATQGVKSIRGKNYATIRMVPCGGARHEFECYIAVRKVEGLEPGYYHYMPDRHAIEQISPQDADMDESIINSLCGQKWAAKASAVMYYSTIPYRAEWRYGIYAHRALLIDAGHITENLYIACSAAGLGTCAVAAVETGLSDAMFGLDGEDEFIFYAAPVGTISPEDEDGEAQIYAFVRDEKGAASPQ